MDSFNTLIRNKSPKDCKIMVAMSGGVDSSTIAAYLSTIGYKVIGVTLQLYSSDASVKSSGKTCCAGQDIYDAKRVAEQFNFPHYVINLEKTFKKDVIEDFAKTYLEGKTPIPCVKCNQTVKFRDLLKIAKNLKVDALVTGHYIRRVDDELGPELYKAKDLKKDQSYFLFATTRQQLEFLHFPLGNYTKQETRDLAKELNVSIADKPESQDICFVKGKSYTEIINKLKPQHHEEGSIVHINGGILGTHKGIIHYTVGQRQGLNISYSCPLYVVKINKESNEIIVGPKSSLEKKSLQIKDVNWLSNQKFTNGMNVEVKLRSGAEITSANIFKNEDNLLKVELNDIAKCAISPGQACVIYNKNKLLGGGWII